MTERQSAQRTSGHAPATETAKPTKTTAGKTKSNGSASRTANGKTLQKQESGIVKRVKKLFGGKTKKKPSNAKGSAMSTTTNSIYTRDDKTLVTTESTPDAKSVASTVTSKKSHHKTYLQIVLLLMDPTTRRFELLQLEFDSSKAKVSDILHQIPRAATEDIIKTIVYTGVCDASSIVKTDGEKLSGFCKGKDVLVAIPEGLDVHESIRLARPILGDDKVVEMLESTGADMTPWKFTFAKAKEADLKAVEATTQAAAAAAEATTRAAPTEAAEGRSITKENSKRSFPWIAFIAFVIILLQLAHTYFTSPLEVGEPLTPGSWRSKCGLLGFVTSCNNTYLEVAQDGLVHMYDANMNVIMTMHGHSCDGAEGCVDGLVLTEDGHVEVGGKKIRIARASSSDFDVTPWPFQEMPKLQFKAEPKFAMFTPI